MSYNHFNYIHKVAVHGGWDERSRVDACPNRDLERRAEEVFAETTREESI